MEKKGKANHSHKTAAVKAPGATTTTGKPNSNAANKHVNDSAAVKTSMSVKADTKAKKAPALKAPIKDAAADITAASKMIAEDTKIEADITETVQVQGAPVRLKVELDGLLPLSFVGGLLGMLVAILPATIWMMIFRSTFYPLYMLIPIFIYGGITLFRGCRDIRAVVLTGILSLAGAYLTAVFCQAADYVADYKMSAVNIPLVAADLIGKKEALVDPFFSSANILPLVFTIIGYLIAMLFFKYNQDGFTDEPVSDNEGSEDAHQDDKLEKAK